MLALVGEGGGAANKMENEFESKLRIENNSSVSNNNQIPQRSKSFAFRAPQENFTIQDFQLGKIYGVGSYSKVVRAKKEKHWKCLCHEDHG